MGWDFEFSGENIQKSLTVWDFGLVWTQHLLNTLGINERTFAPHTPYLVGAHTWLRFRGGLLLLGSCTDPHNPGPLLHKHYRLRLPAPNPHTTAIFLVCAACPLTLPLCRCLYITNSLTMVNPFPPSVSPFLSASSPQVYLRLSLHHRLLAQFSSSANLAQYLYSLLVPITPET